MKTLETKFKCKRQKFTFYESNITNYKVNKRGNLLILESPNCDVSLPSIRQRMMKEKQNRIGETKKQLDLNQTHSPSVIVIVLLLNDETFTSKTPIPVNFDLNFDLNLTDNEKHKLDVKYLIS